MTDTALKAGTALHTALVPLSRRGNPFARLGFQHFEHAQALAEAFVAGNTLEQVYACIRFARRHGMLPEGCYLGGYMFEAFHEHPQSDELDVDELPALREHAWAFRDAVVEVSVAVANCAA